MKATPSPVGRDSRRFVLTQEAVELLDQELRKWWEQNDECRETTGKRKILSRAKKSEKLGVDEKTVDRIYRRQPLTESVLRTAFSALNILPPFSIARYCVLTPLIPGSLPEVYHRCIGRKAEISRIKTLLESTRLVTLTGGGGIGKTRLAIQIAEKVKNYFADGIWFVKLAGLPEEADQVLITRTIATTLNVQEERGRPLIQTLSDFVQGKQLLLILDNCEHLLANCAAVVDHLLSSSAAWRVMATSRERLNISPEVPFRVPSLPTPDRTRRSEQDQAKLVRDYDSVQLFLERAQVQRPDFTVTESNAPVLAAICHRLDGIPLAIELAAARMGAVSLDELERRLHHCFRILTRGDRTAPLRHQTLQATMDWSHDLLGTQSKALLRRLSVFADGCTLEAAEQVCAGHGIEEEEALDLLTSLVEKSLVVFEEHEGQARYRLLETVRQYALEKLQAGGEMESVQQRRQEHYLALVEEAEPHLLGLEQGVWLRRLEAEHENLRATLTWSLLESDSQTVLRFCAFLWLFWWRRGHLSEGRRWCARALDKASDTEWTLERARVLRGAASLAYIQGDYADARSRYEQSITIFREIGDRSGMAHALIGLGQVICNQGDHAGARTLYEQGGVICGEMGDRRGMARSLNGLGAVASVLGDHVSAISWFRKCILLFREIGDLGNVANSLRNLAEVLSTQGDDRAVHLCYEESLGICRAIGDRSGVAHSLNNLGNIAHIQGDHQAARRWYEAGLTICRELGDPVGAAFTLTRLGSVSEVQGDYKAARALYAESLPLLRKIGSRNEIAASLEALANLNAKESRTEQAAVLWGAAEALRQKLGSPLFPNERETYDCAVATARQVLSEEAFSTAWAHGGSMPLEQVIEYATGKPL